MAKVLVLATSRHTHGGISTVVAAHETTQEWREHDCCWIATHRNGSVARKLLYMAGGLARFLVKLPGCRIVHIHTSELPSARRKSIFMKLARMAGKKTIVHFHAFDTATTIDGPGREVYRSLFGSADRVVVLSRMWADAVTHTFPELSSKVRVLFNPCPAIPEADTHLADETSGRNPYILFAGVVNARKGYEQLIKAFAKIAPDFPEWRLVVAGSGETDRAAELAAGLGIADRVDLPGWVAGKAKNRLFAGASVFCLPSHAEGFPMAVLEAWAYGLPVVATPVGGLPEMVEDGRDALLFIPGDTEMLASKLAAVMADEEIQKKFASASKNFAKTTFNIKNIGVELGKIYDELS